MTASSTPVGARPLSGLRQPAMSARSPARRHEECDGPRRRQRMRGTRSARQARRGVPCTSAEATTPPLATVNQRTSGVPAVASSSFSPMRYPVRSSVHPAGTRYQRSAARQAFQVAAARPAIPIAGAIGPTLPVAATKPARLRLRHLPAGSTARQRAPLNGEGCHPEIGWSRRYGTGRRAAATGHHDHPVHRPRTALIGGSRLKKWYPGSGSAGTWATLSPHVWTTWTGNFWDGGTATIPSPQEVVMSSLEESVKREQRCKSWPAFLPMVLVVVAGYVVVWVLGVGLIASSKPEKGVVAGAMAMNGFASSGGDALTFTTTPSTPVSAPITPPSLGTCSGALHT